MLKKFPKKLLGMSASGALSLAHGPPQHGTLVERRDVVEKSYRLRYAVMTLMVSCYDSALDILGGAKDEGGEADNPSHGH